MNNKFSPDVIERREYYRKWRAKNRDRVKKYNADYWKRRAKKRKEAEQNAARAQGTD